eukprot:scaffold34314_cov18-Tisochrysis_lutea.AAC.1
MAHMATESFKAIHHNSIHNCLAFAQTSWHKWPGTVELLCPQKWHAWLLSRSRPCPPTRSRYMRTQLKLKHSPEQCRSAGMLASSTLSDCRPIYFQDVPLCMQSVQRQHVCSCPDRRA